jgi:thymidylate synthase (FAD)
MGNTEMMFAEFAARTAYDSFDKSEHDSIKLVKELVDNNEDVPYALLNSNNKSSALLHQLSHVYFHESTLEHIVFNLLLKDVSRGVLQELARHRLASPTVKSTRYTMNTLINYFLISIRLEEKDAGYNGFDYFYHKLKNSGMLVTTSEQYNMLELSSMYDKLIYQFNILGKEAFYEVSIAKSLLESFKAADTEEKMLKVLNSKDKKNVGDAFKHIITDNVLCDIALTINLRSLKNLLELRLNGSAYFQFQVLAAEIWKQIPDNYKDLLDNGKLKSQFETIDNKY